MDVQGAEAARPYVEAAGSTHPSLVDSANRLGALFGFIVVPNTFLIDEAGRFVAQARDREEVEKWAADASTGSVEPEKPGPDPSEAMRAYEALVRLAPNDGRLWAELAESRRRSGESSAAMAAYERALELGAESASVHFGLGALLMAQGRKNEAVDHLRRALRLEPNNYVIRKQIWALEHPDRFYEGGIDWDWQREQLERERAAQ
ncbi:tetratricopeptide repeat protein [Candidatus Poribacteria bacterium]|nr:tetratricopeptide repeat protein [Candidatus Poribacteria bacterium]